MLLRVIGKSWCEPPGQFLVPVKALSKLIAARFRDALKNAKPEVFALLPRKTWKRAWCSFCKHYGRGTGRRHSISHPSVTDIRFSQRHIQLPDRWFGISGSS
jgi:hypothetical protein